MRPSLLRSKFWFFLIISLVLILAPKSVIADNILSCSARSRCGNIQNIGYPFWGLDRPESCGYPGFKLNCNEDILEITIMSATYQVRAINSTSRIIELARIDYTNNICPTRLINSTFDPSLFQYSSDMQDIRLYYGCLQPLPSEEENLTSIQGNFRQFDCRINETNITGYYVTRNITESSFGDLFTFVSRFLGFCNSSVIIPVPVIEVQSWDENPDPDALEEAFRVGFDLRWSANDNLCNACINSGGQCGHSFLSTEFTCYCSNGSYSDVCPRRSSGKLAKSVIFGLGFGIPGAVIVGILLGMGILRVRQQRRKKIAAQLNSRDLPTPPSSKGPTTSTTNRSQSNPSFSTSNYDVERGSTYFGAHLFSYEELEQATDNFNPSKELGEGGFGTVYYGVLNDGRVVAVKRLYENNFKRVDQYMNEIDILTRIRHPNLVTLYGCTSRRSRELLLVYEYIPNGTVADHLHGNRSNYCSLTWPVRLNITVETAKALAYLHSEDIIHRDVKSNNILLDKNFHVKVADFGLSRLFPTDVTHISTAPQGTPGYVDPEYHQCYQLTEKSDVYSFGVVLIELISAKQAVDINRHRHDINLANMAVSRIQNQALHELVDPTLGFENNYSVKKAITIVAELAFRCLQQQRDMRPSMAEVLETLTEIQDEQLRVQRAEVVDIRSDDVGLLRHIPPPLSPDSATEKWLQIRSDDVGLLKNVPPPLSKDSATDKWLQMRST